MVLQPLSYSYSQDPPGNLSPDHAFSARHFTSGSDQFAKSVLSDMEFFSFAVYAHKQVVSEGKNAGELLESLKGLPYWNSGRLKAYLAKDFLERNGDILQIKFRNGNSVRVFPVSSHVISDNGSIEDGIVPDFRIAGDNYEIQYIKSVGGPGISHGNIGEGGVEEIYRRIWERALPFYEKARPADILHVSWMIREASRIAREDGLDERILLPIVILHDVGYAACMSDEHARAFDADVKIKHMKEGAKISRAILEEVGYDPALTERIVRYVSVHDNWRIGDNSPFKECREMGVFQDLDFTWMATREGFESARTQILNKTPQEMYDFLVKDEKHELRPFAAEGTARLFVSLMDERKRDLDLDGGRGTAMIGFGPALTYEALKISPETRGIYITTEERISTGNRRYIAVVCKTEAGASEKAVKIAEMLDQVLEMLNLSVEQHSGNIAEVEVAKQLDKLKRNIGNKRVYVETSPNLKANSARYFLEKGVGSRLDPDHFVDKMVFNERFITLLYDMWFSHRVEATPEKWTEEVGALWMLAERLFHELDHDSDEIEQIRKDRIFYIAILKKYGFVREAIKFDASMDVRYNGGPGTAPFGEAFGTNAYFHMIHRIAEMKDDEDILFEIKKYLEGAFRHNSSKGTLGLPEYKIDFAQKMLKEHGMSDDLFGETIFGMEFRRFFREHCLFTNTPPYFWSDTDKYGRQYKSRLWNSTIKQCIASILSVGRWLGKEKDTARYINNLLANTRITGKGSTRKKLYEAMYWAKEVMYPQNYQLRQGKLFGSIYYDGLNLMTLPIFPLNDKGEIDWELMGWAYEKRASRGSYRSDPWDSPDKYLKSSPSQRYFKAKKISMYEYLVTHDIPEPPRPKPPLWQPLLFEEGTDRPAADNKPLPPTAGTSRDENHTADVVLTVNGGMEPAGTQEPKAKGPLQLTLFELPQTEGATSKKNKPLEGTSGTASDKISDAQAPQVEEPTLFDGRWGKEGDNGNDMEGDAPISSGTSGNIGTDIKDMHELVLGIDVTPTVDKVTHILIDKSIPNYSQEDILRALNKRSRDELISEKIYFMDADAIKRYIADNACTRDNAIVLLADSSGVEKVGGTVNILVVRKDGATDFVNIEGLLGAARCVLNRDWDAFREIYSALTGAECPEIKPEWLADPVELAKHLIITLPPVRIIDVDEQNKFNEMLKEALVAA